MKRVDKPKIKNYLKNKKKTLSSLTLLAQESEPHIITRCTKKKVTFNSYWICCVTTCNFDNNNSIYSILSLMLLLTHYYSPRTDPQKVRNTQHQRFGTLHWSKFSDVYISIVLYLKHTGSTIIMTTKV